MIQVTDYVHPDTFVPDILVEDPVGDSMTVPNQALKIRDIMERSLRGQLLPEVQGNVLQYGDDMPEDLAELDEMEDRVDVEEYANYLESRVIEQKEALKRAKEEETKQSVVDDVNV